MYRKSSWVAPMLLAIYVAPVMLSWGCYRVTGAVMGGGKGGLGCSPHISEVNF